MTLTTSDDLEQIAADYDKLTAPDIHLDGRMQRALVEPMQTFLGRPNPYPGLTVTMSQYLDKSKVYHPGPEWFGAMQQLPNGPRPAVASWQLWRGGGMKWEVFAYGASLEIAYCAALAKAWAWVLRQAGR